MREEVRLGSSEEPEWERLFLSWSSSTILPRCMEVTLSLQEWERELERETIFMKK